MFIFSCFVLLFCFVLFSLGRILCQWQAGHSAGHKCFYFFRRHQILFHHPYSSTALCQFSSFCVCEDSTSPTGWLYLTYLICVLLSFPAWHLSYRFEPSFQTIISNRCRLPTILFPQSDILLNDIRITPIPRMTCYYNSLDFNLKIDFSFNLRCQNLNLKPKVS